MFEMSNEIPSDGGSVLEDMKGHPFIRFTMLSRRLRVIKGGKNDSRKRESAWPCLSGEA
jgi:hypothetical protein